MIRCGKKRDELEDESYLGHVNEEDVKSRLWRTSLGSFFGVGVGGGERKRIRDVGRKRNGKR